MTDFRVVKSLGPQYDKALIVADNLTLEHAEKVAGLINDFLGRGHPDCVRVEHKDRHKRACLDCNQMI
jgi:hypothetical protein